MKNTIWRMVSFLLAMILLSACGEKSTAIPAEEPKATATSIPLPVPPTRTPTVIPTLTAVPTLSPEQYFKQVSQNWRVAYDDYGNRLCVSYWDGTGKFCIPLGDMFSTDYLDYYAWSADGRQVVATGYYRRSWGIYIWNLDGGIIPFLAADHVFAQPDWSPDGNYIAFASSEMRRHVGQSWGLDIFIRSLDGKTHRNLTRTLESISNSQNPDWSPAGNKIVFQSRGTRPNPNYPTDPWPYTLTDYEIHVVAIDESELVRLTNDDAEDVLPLWSPDGKQIAFLSNREGSFDLYVMNADGTNVKRTVQLEIEHETDLIDHDYYWLPDGQHMLYDDRLITLETGEVTTIKFAFDGLRYGAWLMVPQSNSLIPLPTPHCAVDWTRLALGMLATVSQGEPNRVRSGPGKTAELIGQLYPGTVSKVMEGPICADGLVFWRVENSTIPGGSGWTAEGDGQDYWLEPYE